MVTDNVGGLGTKRKIKLLTESKCFRLQTSVVKSVDTHRFKF